MIITLKCISCEKESVSAIPTPALDAAFKAQAESGWTGRNGRDPLRAVRSLRNSGYCPPCAVAFRKANYREGARS